MANVAIPLKDLVRGVSKKISHAEILRAAGITSKKPSSYMSDVLNVTDSIRYTLADYVLSQTVFAGDPVERALHNLAEGGLSAEQISAIRSLVESMRPKQLPDKAATPILDASKPRFIMQPNVAREDEPDYGGLPEGFVPPEKGRTNRRNEYRIVPYSSEPMPGAVQIPCFESVAAGFGEDLEKSEDLVHVREFPDWKGVHSLIVRGDSMEDTLKPRDLILVETFNNGDGITLEALQPEDEKTPYRQVQKRIPDDEIYVLSIDNEPPTVKRVVYDTHIENDWHLAIVADNKHYKLRVLTRGTPIRFYGRLMAIGKRDDGKKVYRDGKSQEFPARIESKLKKKK